MSLLIQILGALIVFIALGDIFLTVLQGGPVSLVSNYLNRGVWWVFCRITSILPNKRDSLLAYAGPTLLLLTVIMWIVLLLTGFALIFLPAIGTEILANDGETPRGFWTALYFSAMSLSTLGANDIVATTNPYRLLDTLEALIGFSVLTASLTYLPSVYSALIRQNSFALSLHHASGDTGDAAELIIRLGAGGDMSSTRQEVASLASTVITLIESHHTYFVLRYFRHSDVAYALPRIALLSMDTASLLRTALDQHEYRVLVSSSAMDQFWYGSHQLVTELGKSFLPDGLIDDKETDEEEIRTWRQHYRDAIGRLRESKLETTKDVTSDEDRYVMLRKEWQPYVTAFAHHLAYDRNKVSPGNANQSSHDGKK